MRLDDLFPEVWRNFLDIQNGYFDSIEKSISGDNINPSREKIFRAFELKPTQIKVVIIGQDPYPNSEDAVGLAFSVSNNKKSLPGSLRNIKKELFSDLGIEISNNGDLTPWAQEGVMLLNRVLTTKSGESLSHRDIGWEDFTDLVVQKLSQYNLVFILWGKNAMELAPFIPENKKIVGVHPSPLSANRGFFGSKPFSKCNELLNNLGVAPITWKI